MAASPATRPLALLSKPELEARLRSALAQGDGVGGAHSIHELWMRGEFAANLEAALAALWERAGPSIPDWPPMRDRGRCLRFVGARIGSTAPGRDVLRHGRRANRTVGCRW